MIIKRLEVSNFLERDVDVVLDFNEDINIITGYNGSGKTNLLKIIWYTISGNIYNLLEEVHFSRIKLITSEYEVQIEKLNHVTCLGYFKNEHGVLECRDRGEEDFLIESEHEDARDQFKALLRSHGKSLFFPTFRRLEGGFATTKRAQTRNWFQNARPTGDLAEAMAGVSRKLTEAEHLFVTSISTIDISELLLKQYNEMSEEASVRQAEMSNEVIEKIRVFKLDTAEEDPQNVGVAALGVLESIQVLVRNADYRREEIMAPLIAVQKLVSKIFKSKSISMNRRVTFGDAVNAINSELLSAGEKQMLGFICYNAFNDNIPIIIDEPELSLHVDWQRILFPTLISQGKKNQFIIATHSPFIYGKYPEKEIMIGSNRGDGEGE